MAIPSVCTFKKEFLASTTMLYVEDDEHIRKDAVEIFQGLFKEVFVGVDGEEGLELYKNNKNKIDLILTDINMPKLSGLEMLASIREIDWEVPVLITTAFKEPDILLKAIKFNVTNYILKPMQLNTTFKIISNIMEEKELERKFKVQEHELQQFMSILDSQNLICEFNEDGVITYANDLYLVASGYSFEELVGMKHKELNHATVQESKYEGVIADIKKGESKSCQCKKISKTGMIFFTHSTFIPIYSTNGQITKFMEFGIPTTKYEQEILTLKKSILSLKSSSFKSSLDHKSEQSQIEKITIKFQSQLDDAINGSQQLLFEIHELKKYNKELKEKLEEQEKRIEDFQLSVVK